MSEKLFQIYNGPAPTTAAQVAVATTTTLKTMLQVSTPSTAGLYITEWGFNVDGVTTNTALEVELLDTSVAATAGTASVAADIIKWTEPTGRASLMTLGTGNTGYTFGTEGTPALVREIDVQQVIANAAFTYYKQYPLGREPTVDVSRFVRIRAKAATTGVNIICWIQWGE